MGCGTSKAETLGTSVLPRDAGHEVVPLDRPFEALGHLPANRYVPAAATRIGEDVRVYSTCIDTLHAPHGHDAPTAAAGGGSTRRSSWIARAPSATDPLSDIPDTAGGAKTDYIVGELIGKGSFGHVYAATSRVSGEAVALKVMDCKRIKASSIYREWNVLRFLGAHPAVVEYKGTYKTPRDVVFAFEQMRGGELFDVLVKRGAFSEAESRAPFRALADALAYLHRRGIVHRDLKPENLLLKYDTDSIAPHVHASSGSSASTAVAVRARARALPAGRTASLPSYRTLPQAMSSTGQGVGRRASFNSMRAMLKGWRKGAEKGETSTTQGRRGASYPYLSQPQSMPSTAVSGSLDPGALLPMPGGLALEPVLKIADFGLSQLIGPGEKLLKVCGTWAYAAPEMSDPARPGYDTRFDVFSFGVVLYVTLSGYHPFDPSGNLPVNEIKERARAALFDCDGDEWSGVSALAKDLLHRTIVKDPDTRLDSASLLAHPWFRLPGEDRLPLPMPLLGAAANPLGRVLRIATPSDAALQMDSITTKRKVTGAGIGTDVLPSIPALPENCAPQIGARDRHAVSVCDAPPSNLGVEFERPRSCTSIESPHRERLGQCLTGLDTRDARRGLQGGSPTSTSGRGGVVGGTAKVDTPLRQGHRLTPAPAIMSPIDSIGRT